MKKLISVTTRLLAVMVVLLSSLSFAHAQEKNLATTLENRDIPRYVEQKNRMLQGNVDILWVGDSITHLWETSGKAVWDKFYGKRNAMNFAISGDRTGHVLCRIENSPGSGGVPHRSGPHDSGWRCNRLRTAVWLRPPHFCGCCNR